MSDIAIKVEGLGKQYRRGTSEPYYRFSEVLNQIPRSIWRGLSGTHKKASVPNKDTDTFWALRDLNFTVKTGEVVGVIGRNGAGKSTLLKVLSRITEPTTGRFGVRGRVGSLLEVGTGFHPELTGAENIYLSGTLLGMSRHEIKRHFDEIVAFAQIEDFLQTPVKRYSSGMYVRLGFAIAAHLQPEILIVDEVLAVGDAQFQKKCLGKMEEVASQGRTVIFVSHNLSAVRHLCSKAIWLDYGVLKEAGDAEEIVRVYLADQMQHSSRQANLERREFENFVLLSSQVNTVEQNHDGGYFTTSDTLCLEFDIEVTNQDATLSPSLVLKNSEGYPAFNSLPGDNRDGSVVPFKSGRQVVRCTIPGSLLNTGRYSVDLYVVRDGSRVEHRFDDILSFDIEEARADELSWFGKRIGAVRPVLDWCYEETSSLTIGPYS